MGYGAKCAILYGETIVCFVRHLLITKAYAIISVREKTRRAKKRMKKSLKGLLSLALALLMVLSLLPNVAITAYAASESVPVSGLSDTNIGLSYSGSADNAWIASGTTITGSAISAKGLFFTTHKNSTLVIKNNRSTTATLSFDYTVGSGTFQVGGTTVNTGGSYSKELAAGESIKVYIKSNSITAASVITLTNVALVADVTATTTFLPAENGSYTVDGTAITEETSRTQSSMTAYQLAATPNNGYQFMGWYNVTTGKYVATTASTPLKVEENCTITAKFVPNNVAVFETGNQAFDDLGAAIVYAQANNQNKITLIGNGTISGSYTIPTGITLLIPFDDAKTLYTDTPPVLRTAPASKPFRTLTMGAGSSITVNGAISLGGSYYAPAGSQQGHTVGDYGYIKMADGSSITVKSGGNLYAWGFISGSGAVLAESGATVYEFYQIADFRGGSATSTIAFSGNKVFPFSQYFVQNIEVPLTLNAGANEQVYSGIFMSDKINTTAIKFIGDDGMFKVSSGSFTKDYDEKTDRLVFTVNGEAALNTLSLKLGIQSFNSADYVLPITNNITINIQSGNVTINQDAALLAGVQVNIAEDAGLTVSSGKNVYIYDSDEWNSDNFVWGRVPCKFKSVTYAPGKSYNRSNSDLRDAKVDVNGTLTAVGAIYTTAGGADICSSGGAGEYIQQGTPGAATTTYQYNANENSAVTISITAAKLHNKDGSYTETAETAAGTTIPYLNGYWGDKVETFNLTLEPNGADGDVVSVDVPAGTEVPMPDMTSEDEAIFTRDGYDFIGWNTNADGTGTMYENGATITVTENITLYAQWQFWNGWFTDVNGKQYYKDGELQKTGWTVIDGNTYYLDTETGYAATGITTLVPDGATEEARCVFDAEGVFQSDVTGVYSVGNDTYWLNSGIIEEEAGLKRVVKENGEINYYYFGKDGKACKATADTKEYTVEKNNGYGLPEGNNYRFDKSGVIEHFVGCPNGIYYDEATTSYYYCVDGVIIANGLMEIDGSYYYARTSTGAFVRNQTYWVTKTNGLLTEGNYTFDNEGKIVFSVEPEKKNGIVEENGSLYYYVDGVLTGAGLIKIGDDYYYVKTSSGEVVHGRRYWITATNRLLPAGIYNFDKHGRMTDPPTVDPDQPTPEVKNGIVEENGSLYYYVDGVLTGAGLIKIGDDYYYVKTSSGEVVHGRRYWITATNELPVKAGWYQFTDDGKMLIQ